MFVRAYIRGSIILVLCRNPMKKRKQVLVMGVSPQVSLVLSDLNASIENKSGE
jgi:hypothetical protein